MFIIQELKPELKATSKQRKFFRILAGHTARRGITRGELNEEIQKYTAAQIDFARAAFKGQKQATKFVKWILSRLQGTPIGKITRNDATSRFTAYEVASIREATRAWRESGEGK